MTGAWRALVMDLGVVAGSAVTVLALIAGSVKLYKQVARPVRNQWRARREREERAVLMAANVARLIEDVAFIKHEVRYNGGTSVKDMLGQLRAEMQFEQSARRLTNGRAIWEGRMRLDGSYECVHASPEWTRLTGQGREATEDGGWLLAVTPAHRERVATEMDEAHEHQQIKWTDYECVNVLTHEVTPVRHLAVPVMGLDQNAKRHVIGWLAELTVQPRVTL